MAARGKCTIWAVAVAMAAAGAFSGCGHGPRRQTNPGASEPSRSAPASPTSVFTSPPLSPGAPVWMRVHQILQTMHVHAFDPTAPPVRPSTIAGGLYVNWRASWDGSQAPGDNTNIAETGLSDDQQGALPRHDPLTDLVYLHALYGWAAGHPGTHEFDADAARMDPIVRAEFVTYGYDRGWVYFQLVALDRLRPRSGWAEMARTMARTVAARYWNAAAGMLIDPAHDNYRSDYVAETAAMLADAGARFANPTWSSEGHLAATHLLRVANPATGLFPGVLGADDHVIDPLVKVGAQAQLLDALLTVGDLTGDAAMLGAVERATDTLFGSSVGVHDAGNGGFFYAVDADGARPRTAYKETRQAWVLPLVQHLQRLDGHQQPRIAEMLTVVSDRLWQPTSGGYPYRVSADFRVFVSHNGSAHQAVNEDFVTSEAMGIAAQTLEG